MTTYTMPVLPPAAPDLIRGILPAHEVSILSGASGAGKTTLIMQLVAAIVRGETTFFGHEIRQPIRVAYIAADRTWDSYRELANRIGLDLTRLQARSIVDDTTIDVVRLERDPMDLLHMMISSFDSPTLVVVDPMVLFLGVDPNRYHQVAPRLIRMGRWCRQNRFTMLATHHATKARTDYSFKRPQDRISGSSALLGFTSSQLFLSSPEEIGKPYSEFTAVNHNAPPEAIRLERDERGLFVPHTDDGINQHLASSVLGALSKAPLAKKAQLMSMTRIDRSTLDAILDHFVGEGTLSVSSRGEYRLEVRES